ncbi:aminotransferase class V-fold PLP-dependent enzyme, partial [Ruminococcaceae bacterium OttesenSCG-928-A16]|nr:aminotransferase class V-fold PLP-dependent enzyme [Ruminococcaceae bacterium OttesenSCG-928-A16]
MIYFDHSATSLQKPPDVAQATAWAIDNLGNAGRSFYAPAMHAARAIHATRAEIATLVNLQNPLGVAFTASATEALNLVTTGLLAPQNAVITTVLEHNSVLRPLLHSGCALAYVGCDDEGSLLLNQLEALLTPQTTAVFCTHGSNLTGAITNLPPLQSFCQKHGLLLVLDVAQTLGQTTVTADMGNLLCFAGHKGLFGPQGTGGVIAQNLPPMRVAKTGGTGAGTFAALQPAQMPDIFEAGTANAHSLHGLQKGVQFVNKTGVAAIEQKCQALTAQFLQGIANIPGIT